MKDFYRILNVPSTATPQHIRKAFRVLAFAYHPDRAGADAATHDRFIEIREAYETLIHDNRRREYDEAWASFCRDQRENQQRQQAARSAADYAKTATQGTNRAYSRQSAEDAAAGAKRAFRRAPHPPPRTGPRPTEWQRPLVFDAEIFDPEVLTPGPLDVAATLEIPLEQSLRPWVYPLRLTPDIHPQSSGMVRRIRIPGKLWHGASLLVRTLGMCDPNTGERGDLRLDVVFAAPERFRFNGTSLFYDVVISPWEAALGVRLEVPTVEGHEIVEIPPIVKARHLVRLNGRGVYMNANSRGDLWVNVQVELAIPPTARAKHLMAELAKEYARARGETA